MAKYLTLQACKSHLNVDFDEDDFYIKDLASMVEAIVEAEVGEPLEEIEDENGCIPKPLKHAMLLMLAHFYTHREPVMVGASINKIPLNFDYLVSMFKNWTIK